MNAREIRQMFPILDQEVNGKPLVYLDSAATAQKPNIVIDTMQDFYQNHYGTVHRAIYQLSAYATAQYEEVRKKAQKLLNAEKVEEIIFARGNETAVGICALLYSSDRRTSTTLTDFFLINILNVSTSQIIGSGKYDFFNSCLFVTESFGDITCLLYWFCVFSLIFSFIVILFFKRHIRPWQFLQ